MLIRAFAAALLLLAAAPAARAQDGAGFRIDGPTLLDGKGKPLADARKASVYE